MSGMVRALGCTLVLFPLCLHGEPATGWRTDGSGKYPSASPPTEWSSSKNVIWATSMPDWSNSSPVISDGLIFVCAEPATLVCVRASDGKLLWKRANPLTDVMTPEETARAAESEKRAEAISQQITPLQQELLTVRRALRNTPDDKQLTTQADRLKAKLSRLREQMAAAASFQMPQTHGENGYSSCTPTTDGKFVYTLFGTGVAACYDFEGNRKWIKLVARPTDGNGLSSSPLLVGNKLLVLIGGLIALNAETGDVLWRAAAQQRYGSPVCAKVGDEDVVVTPGGEIIRIADGKVLASGLSSLDYCAPIVDGDVAYFIQAGGKAVKLPPHSSDAIQAEALWTTNPFNDRYYASPVLHEGFIYAVTQAGEFSVINARTGDIVRRKKLELGENSTVYSSVTLAGNLLYVSGESGTTAVMQADRGTKEVARNPLERFRSSPVFVGGRMYVRGRDKLYCIGTK